VGSVTDDHRHIWVAEALCTPPQRDRATVLFHCKGCPLIAYGHAVPDEIQERR
jgi:hypothetical protein